MQDAEDTLRMTNRDHEDTFHIRDTARRRTRRATAPLPAEVIVHVDGSAVVVYEDHERLTRFESIAECLLFHDLTAMDLEPIDGAVLPPG